MGQSKDTPKPDESYLSQVDPELLAHSLVTILLKNTSLQPALLQEALKAWRERFIFHGEPITLIDVLVQNGHLERYKVPALVKAAEYALKRRDDKLFGKRAFRKGLITQTQLDDAIAFQKQLFKALYEVKRLEKILVDDGFLTLEDAQEIWAEYDQSKEKRRGVARPASLQRAARSLGIDIGIVGTSQEPTEATGADESDDSDEDADDFFAPVGRDEAAAAAAAAAAKDDSVMELASFASASNGPPDVAGDEDEFEDPAALLNSFLPTDAPRVAATRPQSIADEQATLNQKRLDAERRAAEDWTVTDAE